MPVSAPSSSAARWRRDLGDRVRIGRARQLGADHPGAAQSRRDTALLLRRLQVVDGAPREGGDQSHELAVSLAEAAVARERIASASAPMIVDPADSGVTSARRSPSARALVGTPAGPKRRSSGSSSASITRKSPEAARCIGWSGTSGTRRRNRTAMSPGPDATRQSSPS